MQSESSEEARSVAGATDTRGKHRISAELKRLEQETRFLEEELEQLDKIEKASAACKEMLTNVETKPDPLLPLTQHMSEDYNKQDYCWFFFFITVPWYRIHFTCKGLGYFCLPERMVLQIQPGTDGLKDYKILLAAGAGSYDGQGHYF